MKPRFNPITLAIPSGIPYVRLGRQRPEGHGESPRLFQGHTEPGIEAYDVQIRLRRSPPDFGVGVRQPQLENANRSDRSDRGHHQVNGARDSFLCMGWRNRPTDPRREPLEFYEPG